jgi:cyclohexyl-isocyanide hydratase
MIAKVRSITTYPTPRADVAKTIQLAIEYAPDPPFASGRPEIAEPHIVEAVKTLFAAFAETRRDAIAQMTGRA